MSNKKTLFAILYSTLAVLLISMFLPGEHTGRYVAAAVLIPVAVISRLFIKKRAIPSMHQREILLISSVCGAVFVTLYFLTGLEFGFYKNPYTINFTNFLSFIVPISVIVVSTEIFRNTIRAQEDKHADIIAYICCVLAEALIYGNVHHIVTFNRFMDLVGLTLFPAVIANLLYGYLTKRYGMYPNIVYRLIISLYIYIIPIVPQMADSLFALYSIAFPIFVFLFIDTLYEKKLRYALVKKSKLAVPLTVAAAAIIIGFVMLVSNQFRFGTLVIATPSMTGELNRGDAAIFERYDDQTIVEGQVIVFEENDVMIVHRVADIKIINGITQYYTKGDANDVLDEGFRVDSDIVGLVNFKVPYVGYPTLLLRSLFKR